MELTLNSKQRSDLRRLEKIVDDGKKTFIEVGTALKTIRDEKLHRETHGSFTEYAEDRFGFKKSHAYQLIASSDTAEIFRHGGKNLNERQAREVAKAPEKQQEKVVERAEELAREEGGKPTADTYRRAREEVLSSGEDEYEDVEFVPAAPNSPAAREEEVLSNASPLKEVISLIRGAINKSKAIGEASGTEMFVARQKSILRELENCKNSVAVTIPAAVCPRCKGKRCPQCGNNGWVNSVLAKELG